MKSKNNLKFEIIVVDDNSQDLSTEFLKSNLNGDIYKDVILIETQNAGAANARNIGAKAAKGKYLFFCDAHIKVPDNWLDSLVNTLISYNADLVAPCIADMSNILAAGYGQTWDSELRVVWLMDKPKEGTEIPIAGGAALGITKEAFEKIDGFQKLFMVWGKEDEEICLRAWLYGYKIVVNPRIIVQHLFRKKFPYEVTAANVIYNMLCLAYCHFGKKRRSKTIQIAKNNPFFSIAANEVNKNVKLIINQRNKYFKERNYSDDFFFEKFNIPF
jgi:GT2 family glycosyltransferase